MTKVQAEYQRREKLKMERRPKRSATELKQSVPTKSPAKRAATKLAKPCDSQEALGGGREDAAGVEGWSNVGGEEEVVKFEAGAEGEQQDQFAEITGGRQAVEASRDGDAVLRLGALCLRRFDRRFDGRA